MKKYYVALVYNQKTRQFSVRCETSKRKFPKTVYAPRLIQAKSANDAKQWYMKNVAANLQHNNGESLDISS